MTRILAVILFAIFMCGCCPTVDEAVGKPTMHWIFNENPDEVKGAVILVHGLNVNSYAMDPLGEELRDLGFHVVVPVLNQKGSVEEWIETVKIASERISRRYPDLPQYAVGHSAGAATILAYLHEYPEHKIKAVVLLAPAIKITKKSVLLRPLLPLRYLGVSLPSFASRRIRTSAFTPLKAYNALLDLVDKFGDMPDGTMQNSAGVKKVNGLIIVSKDDELVRADLLDEWLKKQGLNWPVKNVSVTNPETLAPQHQIFDKTIVGDNWGEIVSGCKETLK